MSRQFFSDKVVFVHKKQVVYLNLLQFSFPVTAIASILHRVSGVLLFLFIPLLLWALQKSLSSESGFMDIINLRESFLLSIILWAFLSALFYHLLAGIRHMLMDLGIGDSKSAGRLGAYLVIILSGIFAVLAGGVLLW